MQEFISGAAQHLTALYRLYTTGMRSEFIPIHDFAREEREPVSFRYIPLHQRADYDTSKAHRHSYYEIFLFHKGGGSHEIDFGSHNISDRSIHFVSPGQVHKVHREPESYGSILLFSRDFYYLGSGQGLSLFEYPFLNTQLSGSPVVQLGPGQFEELTALSQAMGKEKQEHNASSAEVIRTYLHLFLLKCKQYAEMARKEEQRDTGRHYSRLQHLLETNYREQHLPSYYADELAVSSKKLNEICKAHTGLTMHQLIRDRIMLEAKRLLLHSSYSIKEISYFLGFEDPAYFNRFFRKNTEMSAGDFRKQKNNPAGAGINSERIPG